MNRLRATRMSAATLAILSGCLLLAALATACRQTEPSAEQISATVDTAVAPTVAAGAAAEATDTSASAPDTMAPTPPPPTAVPVDTTGMSEEELAAAIGLAVAAALDAADDAESTASEATSDGEVSGDEVAQVEVTLTGAEEALDEVEALVAAYTETYGAYASDTLETLEAMESDLASVAEDLDTITEIITQGAEAAAASAAEIEAAAQSARTRASGTQVQAQQWQSAVNAARQDRAAAALTQPPTDIAADRKAALESSRRYAQIVGQALADKRVSPQELSAIATAGANAGASLRQQGPELQQLADRIDAITGQVARGEWPQAIRGLEGFESLIPTGLGPKPVLPNRPGGRRP